jgi:hypothetical protein
MATLLKANGTEESVFPETGAKFSLEELQNFVGGYIEYVRTSGNVLVVNEEGLLRGLPPNPAASLLCGRFIVGDAVHCTKREAGY